MAATTKFYGLFAKHLLAKEIDWINDTVKVALITSGYSPNQDTDEHYSDVSGSEIAASGGYTTGGASLTTKAKTYDAATNEERMTADNLTWSALTASAAFRYGVIYDSTATSELIAWIDFGADQQPAGSDFTISWAATGVGYLLAS
jgi:hypothetical protein